MEQVPAWADQILLVGVATARIATAFLLIPLFATETIPALIRNSIMIAMGLIVLAIHPAVSISSLSPLEVAQLFAKEIFVGLVIGFFFGAVLWALEAAGQIIDAKVGATMAQVVDPLAGHQTSLNGSFLGRLANLVFLFSGGLMLLVGVVMESYASWPISAAWPTLSLAGLRMFEIEFGRLMALAILFAAPALTVLYLIDAGLGLVNRFAQQLNVFSLSMSIKAAAATLIILLLMGRIIDAVQRDLVARPQVVGELLRALQTP